MTGLKRFKTFRDSRDALFETYYKRGFDPDRARFFLAGFDGWFENPYKPGIYRFKSFEKAREFSREVNVRRAVEREKDR